MSYETRPGDTPAIIAKEQLGDCNRWREVVEWNLQKCGPMGPHDWYRVGTFLRLPEAAMSAIDELSRKFVSGNDVQVERASFTREEWQSVVDERDQLRDALSIAEGLAKQNKEMAEGFIHLRDRVAELEDYIQCTPEAVECRYNGECEYKSPAALSKIKAEAVREAVSFVESILQTRDADMFRQFLEEYANQMEADNG